MTQISAHQRLLTLPAVFKGADLTVRFQWASKTASHYLFLWKNRGLVASLGGHSDVYANLVVNPRPNWEAAVRLAMPTAIVMGIEVLRRAGWTTQIPVLPTIAVNSARPTYQVQHFEVAKLEPRWFKQITPGIRTEGPDSLPALAPAWALADLVSRRGWGNFGIEPDDIDWGAISDEDQQDWSDAFAALGLPLAELSGEAEGMAGYGQR